MNASTAKFGQLYRIIKCPATEYLTIGAIYRCTAPGAGFHRPETGAGTYLSEYAATQVVIDEVRE